MHRRHLLVSGTLLLAPPVKALENMLCEWIGFMIIVKPKTAVYSRAFSFSVIVMNVWEKHTSVFKHCMHAIVYLIHSCLYRARGRGAICSTFNRNLTAMYIRKLQIFQIFDGGKFMCVGTYSDLKCSLASWAHPTVG